MKTLKVEGIYIGGLASADFHRDLSASTKHRCMDIRCVATLYLESMPFYDHHSNTTTVFFRLLTQAQGQAELAQLMQGGT